MGFDEFKRTAKRSGKGWIAKCPAHDDRVESLSISEGEDGRALVYCHAGCSVEAIVAALGISMADLFPKSDEKPEVQTAYEYRDELGAVLFEVVRLPGKVFRQRRPIPGGGWEWNLTGVRRVLYRLPELLASPHDATVFVVEGEKDADKLARLGLTATTSPGGAGKWKPEYSEFLRGRNVVAIPDNDPVGKAHAETVVTSTAPWTPNVRVLALPGLPEHGDVSDWLASGGTAEELVRLASASAGHPTVFSDPNEFFVEAVSDPLPLGLSCLDKLRIEPGSLSVVAARPGGGKSAMLATFALAAATQGWQVLLLSLEMPALSLKRRFAAMVSGLSLPEVITPTDKLRPHLERAKDLSITILDQSSLGGRSLPAILTAIRAWQGERRVVLLDYLQRIQPERAEMKRHEAIGEWCRALQSLAQTQGLPIVVAAQLGRAVEQRGKDSRPQLSDLRESGDIEAEADNVLLIWRDGKRVELSVRKQRMGEEFPAKCFFDGPRCRFEDMDWQ